jgi:hypothetical protein
MTKTIDHERLIKAATEMLSMLDCCLSMFQCVQAGTDHPESIQHTIDDLRALIAKSKVEAA